MARGHHYSATITWTGNDGPGTADYRSYRRDHLIEIDGKPTIPGSSDPSFRGDSSRYNPEELLVASLSSCHMLWYLHLCAEQGIVVQHYRDRATGDMIEDVEGSGRFSRVTLYPEITFAPGTDLALAESLHERAHHHCFIANSVNFPVVIGKR